MKTLHILTASAAALALAACGGAADDAAMEDDAAMADEMVNADATTPGTIVEVAQGNPDFSTLVAAVTAADLGETLSGEGPFTVFAPTNEAFAALPAGVLTNLLKPESKAELVKILEYHVLAANFHMRDG